MKASFPGYYPLTGDELSNMWKDSIFVLDASVLLNLYRYSQATKEELLEILKEISERVWVPNQAALEYHRNRLDVIDQQVAAYESVKKLLDASRGRLENELRSLAGKGRHSSIDADHLLERLSAVFAEVEDEIDALRQQHPDLTRNDPIRDTITNLLEGKIGPPYPPERLADIYKAGKARYETDTPPGYLDSAKGNTRQYGDLVMWFQIIDHANSVGTPIILVTDDRKDDWWLRFKGQTIGPRPELVNEMLGLADVGFHMYSTDPFMEHAKEHLHRKISEQAIEEIREVRQHDEEHSMADYLTRAAFGPYASIEAMRRLQLETTEIARAATRFPREVAAAFEAERQLRLGTMEAMRAATLFSPEVMDAFQAARHLPPETLRAIWGATHIPFPSTEAMRAAGLLPREPEQLGSPEQDEATEPDPQDQP
jgi:hypothetical protein